MSTTIQCLRCYKRIPVTQDMVGQTVLCPSCMERVYVTEGSLWTAKEGGESASAKSPIATPSLTMSQRPLSLQHESERSFPMGLVATIGGGVALILVVVCGMVFLRAKPGQDSTPQAQVNAPPPPPAASQEVTQVGNRPEAKVFGAPLPSTSPGSPTSANIGSASGGAPKLGSLPVNDVKSLTGSASAPATSERWAEVWKLPAYAATGESVLLSVGDSETAWRASINSSPMNLPIGSGMFAEADKDQRSWTLKHGSAMAAPSAREVLAELRRNGADVTFVWSTPLNERAAPQLKNCLIELSSGRVKRVGQLREPLKMEPIKLDLMSEKQVIEGQLDDPPKSGGLQGGMRFEIVALSGFSSEAKVRNAPATPGMGMMQPSFPQLPGQPAAVAGGAALPVLTQSVIEFEVIPALELRVVVREAAGKLAISTEPVFRESPSAAWRDLRAPRLLDRLERDEQRALAEARQRLQPAEKSLRFWQGRDRELQSNQPAATNRGYPAWQQKAREAAGKLAQFQKDVDLQSQAVEKSEALLDVIPKLREFIKGSHDQATIRYVVYSECGERDLLLINGTGESMP